LTLAALPLIDDSLAGTRLVPKAWAQMTEDEHRDWHILGDLVPFLT
jgi:hypothetical protein